MPSRRHHAKSRHGCTTCKERKVRCDQEHPICRNCNRLGKKCSFLDSAPLVLHGSRNQPLPSPEAKAFEAPSTGSSLSCQSPRDLELMHYYTVKTCFTMTDNESLYPIWQLNIPKHSFSHPFLMHGILALAALHRRLDCSALHSSAYDELAKTHQEHALASYIPLLQSIDEGNCHALFAFSQIIAGMSFASLKVSENSQNGPEFIKSTVAVFDLLMGAIAIATQARAWLRQGDMSPMMGLDSFPSEGFSSLTQNARMALEALLGRIHSRALSSVSYDDSPGIGEEASASMYTSRIRDLDVLLPRSDGRIPKLGQMLAWPLFDPHYISLLKNQDAMALVILAHYGVGLHMLNSVWWLTDLGARLVRAVSQSVEEDWQPYLAWAMDQTSENALL